MEEDMWRVNVVCPCGARYFHDSDLPLVCYKCGDALDPAKTFVEDYLPKRRLFWSECEWVTKGPYPVTEHSTK